MTLVADGVESPEHHLIAPLQVVSEKPTMGQAEPVGTAAVEAPPRPPPSLLRTLVCANRSKPDVVPAPYYSPLQERLHRQLSPIFLVTTERAMTVLLLLGADINVVVAEGEKVTPLIYAIRTAPTSTVDDAVKESQEEVLTGPTEGPALKTRKMTGMVELLLRMGADVNYSCSRPPLLWAVAGDKVREVLLLIRYGLNGTEPPAPSTEATGTTATTGALASEPPQPPRPSAGKISASNVVPLQWPAIDLYRTDSMRATALTTSCKGNYAARRLFLSLYKEGTDFDGFHTDCVSTSLPPSSVLPCTAAPPPPAPAAKTAATAHIATRISSVKVTSGGKGPSKVSSRLRSATGRDTIPTNPPERPTSDLATAGSTSGTTQQPPTERPTSVRRRKRDLLIDIDRPDASGRSPIVSATEALNARAVEEVLRAGADINVRGVKSPWMPLLMAIQSGKKEIVACMLQRGLLDRWRVATEQGTEEDDNEKDYVLNLRAVESQSYSALTLPIAENKREVFELLLPFVVGYHRRRTVVGAGAAARAGGGAMKPAPERSHRVLPASTKRGAPLALPPPVEDPWERTQRSLEEGAASLPDRYKLRMDEADGLGFTPAACCAHFNRKVEWTSLLW